MRADPTLRAAARAITGAPAPLAHLRPSFASRFDPRPGPSLAPRPGPRLALPALRAALTLVLAAALSLPALAQARAETAIQAAARLPAQAAPALPGQDAVPAAVAPAAPELAAFREAVAAAAASDADLATFYRMRGYNGIWTGTSELVQDRRNALLSAFADAPAHGLPAARYDAAAVMDALRAAATPAEQGRMEVELSRLLLGYARDVQTGILTPGRVDPLIKREVALRSRLGTLQAFAASSPVAHLRSLPPAAPEYGRLMREKLRLEGLVARGGWGPSVVADRLELGAAGPQVVALRNRLIAMGYMGRTASDRFDGAMLAAVQRFQAAHGLAQDGIVGPGTLAEINTPAEDRLRAVIVAMERERWTNAPRGDRHIWVNLTDFTAAIIDHDVTTFRTRSVVGATATDRQSPEFSDVMEFMVVNPTWYVPRSIITKEYLPQLQKDPGAVGQLVITDRTGREIDRGAIDFAGYTAATFPFAMREPPSQGNALGLVKFMFPNPYNIYLHDTPAKSLFGREVRAFSHGCIRLADPFDFAHALLAPQTEDPQAFFAERLQSGRETRVDLQTPVPVHLDYRTAFTLATGELEFRRDVYGRDARIWAALQREGVEILAPQG